MRHIITHVADTAGAKAIMSIIINPQLDVILVKLLDKVSDLLKPYQHGHPITYNHYFTETLQRIRTDRLRSRFRTIVQSFVAESSKTRKRLEEINFNILADDLVAQSGQDMDRFAAEEALDCSEAYYKACVQLMTCFAASS